MNELKSSTKVLLLGAVITLVILATGPFGYKLGFVALMPSLVALLVALIASIIVLLAGVVFVVLAARAGQASDRNMLLVSMVLALVPVLVMAPQILTAQSVPPIHDITTDTQDPPTFDAIVKLRSDAVNSLEYGDEQLSAEELAKLQVQAYPNVEPIDVMMSAEDALNRAAEILESQGLEVVNVDIAGGRVEATATTFWFGFKDDVVVRATSRGDSQTRLDVRSISRVGQSDLGANAARIEKFLAAFGRG